MQIDKNVPVPEAKYPFAEMNVGDSLLANSDARSKSHPYGDRLGFKFKTKREGNLPDGQPAYRIWRIA